MYVRKKKKKQKRDIEAERKRYFFKTYVGGEKDFREWVQELESKKVKDEDLIKNCLHCQKEFIPKHWNFEVCSPKCQKDRIREKARKRIALKRLEKKVKDFCITCESAFVKKNRNQIACSKICSLERIKEMQLLYRKKKLIQDPNFHVKYNQKRNKASKDILCKVCKTGKVPINTKRNIKTCSKKCSLINQNESLCKARLKAKLLRKFEWWYKGEIDGLSSNKKCEVCGKSFERDQLAPRKIACSVECSEQRLKQTKRKHYLANKETQIKKSGVYREQNREKINQLMRNLRKRKMVLSK